jgi:hypothetical protein
MGIQDLHTFIQSNVPGASVLVDLLRISRKKPQQPPGRKYRLVLDAECCLDRLYGGFFSGNYTNLINGTLLLYFQ